VQDRIIFGTSYPLVPVERSVKEVEELPLKDEVKPQVAARQRREVPAAFLTFKETTPWRSTRDGADAGRAARFTLWRGSDGMPSRAFAQASQAGQHRRQRSWRRGQ